MPLAQNELLAQIAPPTPPQPPAIPGGATITTTQLQQRPMTKADVDALKARRNELSNQLNSAQERRDDAAKALTKSAPGPASAGIEQRLAVLDQRIVQIETDIAANGRQLAAAPSALVAGSEVAPTERYGPFSSGQLTAISIVSIVLIGAPLAFATARTMLKRWAHAKPAPQLMENAARLERMEQAVDAVAIEVERISEGQRFVTQLMTKRAEPAALGEGMAPAEPIKAAQPEQVSFDRR